MVLGLSVLALCLLAAAVWKVCLFIVSCVVSVWSDLTSTAWFCFSVERTCLSSSCSLLSPVVCMRVGGGGCCWFVSCCVSVLCFELLCVSVACMVLKAFTLCAARVCAVGQLMFVCGMLCVCLLQLFGRFVFIVSCVVYVWSDLTSTAWFCFSVDRTCLSSSCSLLSPIVCASDVVGL